MVRSAPIVCTAFLAASIAVARAEPTASSRSTTQPATQPAPQTPAVPPTVGVRVIDPLITDALALLEAGRAPEAVAKLRASVSRGKGRSPEQLNELRLGLGLVLLRAGDPAGGRKLLLPISRLAGQPELAGRAQVLLAVAKRAPPKSPAQWPWLRPERWEAALVRVVEDVISDARREHAAVARCIGQRRWVQAGASLDRLDAALQRAAAVDLEAAALAQRDLGTLHAGLLAAEVRDLNVAVAQMIKLTTDLSGQMSMKFDSRTKRRGYLPADVVTRYNAAADELAAASALGERIVGIYLRVVNTSAGRIKRDSTVRMTRTSLPAKRVSFGR